MIKILLAILGIVFALLFISSKERGVEEPVQQFTCTEQSTPTHSHRRWF